MTIWQLTQVLPQMKSGRLFLNLKQTKRQVSMELCTISLRMKIPYPYSPIFLIYVLNPTKSRMSGYKALYIPSFSHTKKILVFYLITEE